ncbi:MAG: Uma2 family endonuclease [Isosphaeraceae bacterium]
MSKATPTQPRSKVVYPETDGEPIAENTLQFQWIVTIKEGFEAVFLDRPDVFVAGDLFWYPVEGDPTIRTAPDALVVFGRPKGHRSSYLQWQENGIAPQVVVEVLSPGNRVNEMLRKFRFYERFGVNEYYIYDPDNVELFGWLRRGEALEEITQMNGWTSPQLGVRFELSQGELTITGPDGRRFLTFSELVQQRNQLEQQRNQLERELEQERSRAQQLEDQLRSLRGGPSA